MSGALERIQGRSMLGNSPMAVSSMGDDNNRENETEGRMFYDSIDSGRNWGEQ